jgi:hypothetical protein
MNRLHILLESARAVTGVMPWGVADLPSAGMIFVWDARPDASRAILEVVAAQHGMVVESDAIDDRDETLIGVLIAAKGDIEDAAAALRLQYLIASGGSAGERPF